jgi:hypothetical protein
VKLFALALLAVGLAAGLAACATEAAPTFEPVQAPPVTEVPTAVPTVAPTLAPAAVPLTPEELLKLRQVAYLLEDGTTVSPASAAADGALALMVDKASVRKGDLNGDGVEDAVVVLVNTAGELGPEVLVAPVINEGGTYTSPGVITFVPETDVRDVVIGDDQITMTVWEKSADGTAYVVRQATYKYENGAIVEVTSGEPVPAPAPPAASDPAPAAPQITMSLSAEETKVGEQVDIYVHAFESPAIMTIELHRDGEKVDEWTSPDPAGVPYVHHTFTWTPDSDGDYEFTAIARDQWGGEGWSDPEDLEVSAATE